MDHQVIAWTDFDGECGPAMRERMRQRLDAAVQCAAATGNIGQNRRERIGGLF